MFCSSNERKIECPPEEITMNINEYYFDIFNNIIF